MIIVNQEKCSGCGSCVADCTQKIINLKNGKAKAAAIPCIECGHCVAICPESAISLDTLDQAQIEPVQDVNFSSVELLNFIKARRSIRQFTSKAVEREKLLKMIQAGRFTPTASNLQGGVYIVIEKEMAEFKKLVFESLANLGQAVLADPESPSQIRVYAQRWVNAGKEYNANPNFKNTIFYDAPTVMLIAGDTALDVGLAASNMELIGVREGLGLLYSGFITRACADPKLRQFLGLPENKQVYCTFLIGYTNLKYSRTAPRKEASVTWK